MKKIAVALTILAFIGCKENNTATTDVQKVEKTIETESKEGFKVHPISHATMVLEWDGTTIYVDPVGDAAAFSSYPQPDVILITDVHGDHLSVETVEAIKTKNTKIVAPRAVADKLPDTYERGTLAVIDNGGSWEKSNFEYAAIPMYNLREEALKFHTKGRGNGYVIELDDMRVYISGDTEDIPEMRDLEDIDVAFVCMNLPYTMTEESAASAVLDFKPKKVYPYHYRGTEGLSDVAKFKELVNKGNSEIEVVQLDWYPEN